MTIMRSELQGEIYEILSKSPTAYGLLTPTKVNKMIQDSLDYIATKMLKLGGGWLSRIVYADIAADDPYVTLPAGVAIVNFIKKKSSSGEVYEPIQFNENAGGVSVVSASSLPAQGTVWRFSSGRLFLEPVPTEDVEDGLLIDAVFHPDRLTSDSSEIDGDLDNYTFIHYAKWRAASQLHSLTSSEAPPWSSSELEWKQACLEIIARRFRQPTIIQGFSDY